MRKDILTELVETNLNLGKALGVMVVVEQYLANALDIFESNPNEAKKYLKDALSRIRLIRKELEKK